MSRPPLLWEQHCCLPLTPQADVGQLARYARPGGVFVSVNVGYASHSADDVRAITRSWQDRLDANPRFTPVTTVADVDRAAAHDGIAVAFDLEDSSPLEGRLELVQEFHDAGVRTLLPTYNNRNAAGGGCLDAVDEGLTPYGRALVAEMNRVGMVVDGSHCGRRTGLELSEASTRPMVYSHSCLASVWEHPATSATSRPERARPPAVSSGSPEWGSSSAPTTPPCRLCCATWNAPWTWWGQSMSGSPPTTPSTSRTSTPS